MNALTGVVAFLLSKSPSSKLCECRPLRARGSSPPKPPKSTCTCSVTVTPDDSSVCVFARKALRGAERNARLVKLAECVEREVDAEGFLPMSRRWSRAFSVARRLLM